jgi:hypothetical protein
LCSNLKVRWLTKGGITMRIVLVAAVIDSVIFPAL